MPESWDKSCQQELLAGSGTSRGERSVLQSTKLNRIELVEIILTNMKMQSLEIAEMVFRLALVQYFLTMFPSLYFEMVMFILCHYMS